MHGIIPCSEVLPTKLYRVPETLLQQVVPGGAHVLKNCAGNEIRFCSESYTTKWTFELGEEGAIITVYYGDFQGEKLSLAKGVHTLEITYPEAIRDQKDWHKNSGFSPDVVRLMLQGPEITLINMPEGIRPPTKEQLPALKYLAYGTSITQGMYATYAPMTYPKQVARQLGCDVINLGVSGNAYCEEAMAKYIAHELTWDFASFCISVNMLNQGKTLEEFKAASHKFLDLIAKANPTKPMFCISVFPSFLDIGKQCGREPKSTPQAYRQGLKEVIQQLGHDNIHYIHGPELLTKMEHLSPDLLHPNDFGMIEISQNLSHRIREIL